MNLTINIRSVDELPLAAEQLINNCGDKKLFAFYGDMGAGKTTFIKAICSRLGVKDSVSSPTFSLVNEYHTSDETIIYHFDFYRIKSIHEAYDLGYEDYFYSGNYCLIEWPEKIEELLPEEVVKVEIVTISDDERKIVIRA